MEPEQTGVFRPAWQERLTHVLGTQTVDAPVAFGTDRMLVQPLGHTGGERLCLSFVARLATVVLGNGRPLRPVGLPVRVGPGSALTIEKPDDTALVLPEKVEQIA